MRISGPDIEVETAAQAGDRVVLIASTVGAGEASGAPLTRRWGQVYTFREGKVAAVESYWAATEALAAVGLSR